MDDAMTFEDHERAFAAFCEKAEEFFATPEGRDLVERAAKVIASWDGVTPDDSIDALIDDEI